MVRTSITIDGKRLSDNDFSHVTLRQHIGLHNSCEIRLRQDAKRGIISEKVKSWVGKSLNIGFDFQSDDKLMLSPLANSFQGLVTSVSLSRQRGRAELVVRGQSPTILIDDGPNTRSFTEKTLQEIVDEVLQPYKDKFPETPSVEPKEFTESIAYLVQYNESNFDFLNRLANSYGEWFYYDGLKFFFGKPAKTDSIPMDFDRNGLQYFEVSVQTIPSKFEMRGYDYANHVQHKEEAKLKSKTSSLGKEVLDISTGQVFSQTPSTSINSNVSKGEFNQIMNRREQIIMDELIVMHGSTKNPKLRIGAQIEIKDKELGEEYGVYTITSLTHDIGQGGDYFNQFEATPVEVSTPPLSKMPNIPFCETQLAKVTDVDDEKGLGRIRVKFLWQEGSEEKTPWIRVASPYTGKDKGFYLIPEVDDQVLVAFENNHPDKPYVLTGMYNGDAKPEWFEPKNRFKGFKSKGENQWKFDDKNKSILIHAPSAITMSAGKKITIKTAGKEDSEITLDTGDGTINIKAKKINIEAGELINLNSNKEITETAAQNIKIKGNSKVEVESMEVGVKGTASVKTEGAQVDVNGSAMVNVKGALVKIN